MTVTVTGIEQYAKSGLKEKFIEALVQKVFHHLDKEKNINIAFISTVSIAELNKKYRKKNKATDVLSFDYGDEGDIALCIDEVDKRKNENEDLSEAIERTIVHGVLHIFEFDHVSDEDYDIMKKIEDDILGGS